MDVLHPHATTLVLGSTQAAPPGVDFVRRRSGGGAVLLDPAAVVWIDVVLPVGDRLWSDDVGRAFWWLGDVWAAAIGPPAVRWGGALVRSAWSPIVCFAGLGPGEVTIDGRKVVGMSQRRTRAGALFQCAALLSWDYEETARLLGAPAEELADVAVGLAVDRAVLERRFLAAISAV